MNYLLARGRSADGARRFLRTIVKRIGVGLVVLFTVVVASCAAVDENQWEFREMIDYDRRSLFPAAVYVDEPQTVTVDRPFSLALRICGPEASCEPLDGPTPGSSPGPQVGAGAYMRVQLDAEDGGEFVSQPNEVQPVMRRADSATWRWRVRLSSPGEYRFSFRIAPLRQATELPIQPETTITITVRAEATAGDAAAEIWSDVIEFAESVGVLLGAAIMLSGALAGLWRHRKRLRGFIERLPGRAGRVGSRADSPPPETSDHSVRAD